MTFGIQGQTADIITCQIINQLIMNSVLGGSRKGSRPQLLPCTSKSPTSIGTSEPLTRRQRCKIRTFWTFSGYWVVTPQNCHFSLTCCIALSTV